MAAGRARWSEACDPIRFHGSGGNRPNLESGRAPLPSAKELLCQLGFLAAIAKENRFSHFAEIFAVRAERNQVNRSICIEGRSVTFYTARMNDMNGWGDGERAGFVDFAVAGLALFAVAALIVLVASH